ncbi:hypothetical protein [Stenotrophomonas sp. PS02289]|uniref:hypothetical protein n=1 Tax=Stenotrophomonas sp. PS02289 TaxID=2991422 RepID=UPI00249CD2F3|nr:hypothetical protein [Stenotrophomonas sp. PS02289]
MGPMIGASSSPSLAGKSTSLQQTLQKIDAPLPREPDKLLDLLNEVHNAKGTIEIEVREFRVNHSDQLASLRKFRGQAESLERLRMVLQNIRNPNAALRVTRDGKVKAGVHWLKRMVAPQVYNEQQKRACEKFGENNATAKKVLPRVTEALSSTQRDMAKLNASLAALAQNEVYLEQLKGFANRINLKHFIASGRGEISPAQPRSLWSLQDGDPKRFEGRGGM